MFDLFKTVKTGQLNEYLRNIVLQFKLLLKEEIQMVDMYVALIIAGRRSLPQVPSTFRSEVEQDLTALGLDGNSQPIK